MNMFRFQVTIERQPRTKNGQAPHRTTGVASASSIQPRPEAGSQRSQKGRAMASARTGTVRTALTQRRRVMSRSSGFSSSSTVTVRGSRAMPQIGQPPGWSRTISGCIGQVYSTLVAGTAGIPGSRAMPHSGQLPGCFVRTSGCIGQV